MSNVKGSLELFYEYAPSSLITIRAITDILATPMYKSVDAGMTEISVDVTSEERSSVTWIICKTRLGTVVVDTGDFAMGGPVLSLFKIRIFFADAYVAIYCNDKLVYHYGFTDVDFPLPAHISLKAMGNATTLNNVRRTELADRRLAVYVDYESNAESAIQSVIQQRPVQIIAAVNRALEFTYKAIKATVDGHHISEYNETTQDDPQMSSDGIVYFADVVVSISEATAREVGFITKLYRLSNLDTGALEAAQIYQEQALERRQQVTITMRLDPRIERSDNILIDLIVTGTEQHLLDDLIVEDIQMSLSDGSYSLNLSCRRNK